MKNQFNSIPIKEFFFLSDHANHKIFEPKFCIVFTCISFYFLRLNTKWAIKAPFVSM